MTAVAVGRVAVDALLLLHRRAHPLGDLTNDAVHHLLTVEQSEVLRPRELIDVAAELRRALDKVGEVRVGQRDPPLLHERLRDRDVVLRDSVTDPA